MSKRTNKQLTSSQSKRVKQSFSNEFLLHPSQSHDLRLPYQQPKSLLKLPQSFKPMAVNFFRLMITKSFIDLLFGAKAVKKLTITSSLDVFWTFVAVWISMGLVQLSSVRKHFKQNTFYKNFVATTFISCDLFFEVLRSMKGNVAALVKMFQHNVQSVYSPAVKGSIDEMILAFTGKSSIKVYLPAKPHSNGIKLFTYVDQHGILCSLVIYKKQTIPVASIFDQLLGNFKNRTIKIYADRWFGSRNAMQYCIDNGIKFVLAMPKNRGKEMWQEMRKEAELYGYSERTLRKNSSVRAVSVKVKNIVCNFLVNHQDFRSLSNTASERDETTTQQQQYYKSLVEDYNSNMKKVDQFNQAYYNHLPIIRQSTVDLGIRRALLRFAVINAYRMYEYYHGTKIMQEDFLEMLMHELLGFSSTGWKDFNNGHQFLTMTDQKKCVLCPNRKNPSSCWHMCPRCNKPMCRVCFIKQHQK